jgi:hypothetical protein
MYRVSLAALVVVLALGSAGCADNVLKERPVNRAASASAVKPAFSATGSAQGESSVCAAYRRQLRVVQLRRTLQNGKAVDEQLKGKELSLNAVIADACE